MRTEIFASVYETSALILRKPLASILLSLESIFADEYTRLLLYQFNRIQQPRTVSFSRKRYGSSLSFFFPLCSVNSSQVYARPQPFFFILQPRCYRLSLLLSLRPRYADRSNFTFTTTRYLFTGAAEIASKVQSHRDSRLLPPSFRNGRFIVFGLATWIVNSPRFASFLVIDRRRGNEGVHSRRCVSFRTTNDRKVFPLASVSDEPRPPRHLPTTFPINPSRTCFQRDSTLRFVYEERGGRRNVHFPSCNTFRVRRVQLRTCRITTIIAFEISARDSVEASCLKTENFHRVVDQREDKIN